MKVGLLWYDNDPKGALEEKIGRAAGRYREKTGRWPNTCYVHPKAINGQNGQIMQLSKRKIRVLSSPSVLLHHFWVGETTNKARKPAH
jgi:hypothetical protein